ncbi:RNA-metabolizing metallo-beta-lactamase family protein, partial [human gut metagenome]
MINMIENARALGYINAPEDIFIDIDLIRNYNDEQLVIITTGSQGETMSALTRMAAGEHKKVTITPNDLVIISANAALIKFIVDGFKVVSNVATLTINKIHGEISTEVYPALISVGYICGFKIASYMFAGAILGWLVLIPAIYLFGAHT